MPSPALDRVPIWLWKSYFQQQVGWGTRLAPPRPIPKQNNAAQNFPACQAAKTKNSKIQKKIICPNVIQTMMHFTFQQIFCKFGGKCWIVFSCSIYFDHMKFYTTSGKVSKFGFIFVHEAVWIEQLNIDRLNLTRNNLLLSFFCLCSRLLMMWCTGWSGFGTKERNNELLMNHKNHSLHFLKLFLKITSCVMWVESSCPSKLFQHLKGKNCHSWTVLDWFLCVLKSYTWKIHMLDIIVKLRLVVVFCGHIWSNRFSR